MSAKIHFIGVDHEDYGFGPGRVKNALRYEKPEILAVESNKEVFDYYEIVGIPSIMKRIDSLNFPKAAADVLKERFGRASFMTYESLQYSLRQKIPLHYVDDTSRMAETKKDIDKICGFSVKDFEFCLKRLSRKRSIPDDKVYQNYEKFFDRQIPLYQEETDLLEKEVPRLSLLGTRDDYMAQAIEQLIQNNPDAKIVHVGGLAHCLHDVKGRTLFSKLQQYNPTRKTLKWYEDK